ncbi:hypothetical protein [Paramicrobacterium agarici]|uniref:hypothetical protein n=1 Tax=Paramicrobacterium agarici TaxID=630514 RepID=UPI0011538579|nr:hypothetical protein [Microbacterium agarici]TQO22808.1 hypothetical protein FB385_1648 [Microbacterium agarici]
MSGKHEADDGADAGRTGNLGDLTDVGHTFDQTNGLVDGLSGDADDPENVDDRVGETDATDVPVAAVAPGGTSQGAVPIMIDDADEEERKGERDPDA